ncbi:hypothetical protein ACFLV7_07875 [Chloroflexota bacterium]
MTLKSQFYQLFDAGWMDDIPASRRPVTGLMYLKEMLIEGFIKEAEYVS